MQTPQSKGIGKIGIGLAGLCLGSGSGWLITQAYPSTMPFPLPQLLHFTLIATFAWPASLLFPARTSNRNIPNHLAIRPTLALALAGILLFGLPAIVLDWSEPAVSSFTAVAIFAAIPLITVLTASTEGSRRTTSSMLPALVALGGTLLLFPATLPTTLRGALAFSAVIACAVIAAVASLWIYRLLRDISLLRAIALIATVNALAFILRAAFLQTNPLTDSAIPPELLLGLAYELPLLALTVWLMARVDPVRLSARFLLVPLVTVLEGAVLLRTPLAVRTIVAITIMAIGGLLVLLRRVPQQMPKLLPEK